MPKLLDLFYTLFVLFDYTISACKIYIVILRTHPCVGDSYGKIWLPMFLNYHIFLSLFNLCIAIHQNLIIIFPFYSLFFSISVNCSIQIIVLFLRFPFCHRFCHLLLLFYIIDPFPSLADFSSKLFMALFPTFDR